MLHEHVDVTYMYVQDMDMFTEKRQLSMLQIQKPEKCISIFHTAMYYNNNDKTTSKKYIFF